MNQTYYIDVDEEVTSVIDRLKKSEVTNVFFVVPKRALLLQSLVSLRLLKKEAQSENKNIVIVTQDQQSKEKLEREGIEVRFSLEGSEEDQKDKEIFLSRPEEEKGPAGYPPSFNEDDKINQREIGTTEFFETLNQNRKEISINQGSSLEKSIEPELKNPGAPPQESIINRELAWGKGIRGDSQKKTKKDKKNPPMDIISKPSENTRINQTKDFYSPRQEINKIPTYKEKVIENFFESREAAVFPKKKEADFRNYSTKPQSKSKKKIYFVFIIFVLLLAAGVSTYLYLPSAKIIATVKSDSVSENLNLKSDIKSNSPDFTTLTIPAKTVEKEDSLTVSSDATGKKYSGASQKATGTIVIYNEFSSDTQELVVTTRFLTKDGKIFRLVKGVIVPGTTTVNNSVKPGAIEAEVIADQSGSDYNIEPSDFTIPGFQGTTKSNKIYGKSTKAMTGGGAQGAATNIITQGNIDNAKTKTQDELTAQIKDEIKNSLASGEILLNSAVDMTVESTQTLAKANQVKDKFDYTMKGKVKALVFSQSDVLEMAKQALLKKDSTLKNIDPALITLDYGNSTADLNNGTVSLSIQAKYTNNNKTDVQALKNDLLGKNGDQIKDALKNYPQVEKVDIEFWPQFMSSKIPKFSRRVNLEIVSH